MKHLLQVFHNSLKTSVDFWWLWIRPYALCDAVFSIRWLSETSQGWQSLATGWEVGCCLRNSDHNLTVLLFSKQKTLLKVIWILELSKGQIYDHWENQKEEKSRQIKIRSTFNMKFDVCAVEHDHGCCMCQGRGPGVQTQFVAVCRSKQPSREVLVVGMLLSCTCCRNGQRRSDPGCPSLHRS